MANAQNIQAKAAQVEEISKKIANAQSVIVFDYRGLNAEEVTNLRSDMRKAGVEYVVLKNHIVSRAAHAAGIQAIGLATSFPAEYLRKQAQPDYLLPDLKSILTML